MKKLILFILLCVTLTTLSGSNVKITSAPYIDLGSLKYNNMTTIYLDVEWDNSWRDKENWDAVYIFLKYKKSTDVAWSHVLLRDAFHVVSPGYDFFTAKDPANGADKSTGIFVYRNAMGGGKSTVTLELQWKYNMNGLTRQDLLNGISIEASAIEMVYIPKGPFRPGDQYSKYCFQKPYRQILPEDDLIKPGTSIFGGSWINSNPATMNTLYDDRGPDKVCDHDNDPRTSGCIGSLWISELTGTASVIFDFKSKKTVRYVAMELYNYPVASWIVSGGTKKGNNIVWTQLGAFTESQAPVNSIQTYPATQAIPLPKTGSYQYYKVDLNMKNSGINAYVWTISMTEKNLAETTDDAYIIEGPGNSIAFNNTLGLNIKDGALTGALDANYAVGFEGFYAMKYEMSQRQYVDFLNKLTIDEQKLRTIGEALSDLQMGDYVYGSSNHKTPVCRNGIVVGALQDNRYAFACNLNSAGDNNLYNQVDDGMDIACNFLSPRDMVAYAAWSGLRPLSELEYEKMGHQTIDSVSGDVPTFPIKGYAWGNASAKLPSGNSFSNAGKESERLSSANINAGGIVDGPTRVGSFTSGSGEGPHITGASYYGVMELSGNLAEIYYRSEPGKVILHQSLLSHGKGYLTNGNMPTDLNAYWGDPAIGNSTYGESLILRGGSFAGIAERARFADRGETNGYSNSVNKKDSTVTCRLGHSVTAYQTNVNDYYPYTTIKNENGFYAPVGTTIYDTVCTGNGYTIVGSDPVADGLKPSGEVRYAWYCMMNNNGRWLRMKGKNEKDLKLTSDDLEHYSTTYRTYSYKRRFYTPTAYSESGIVELRVGTNRPFTRDREEVLQANNQINGILVESAPNATFEWYAIFNGKKKSLPAFYTTEVSSYMSIVRDSFPSAGSGSLACMVTTKELGCKNEVKVKLTVYARPTSGTNSNSFLVGNCGSPVVDTRDGEIYTTTMIDDQCWMAENMRFRGENNKVGGQEYKFSPADPMGTTYGVCYRSYIDVANVVCPEGWDVPSLNDMKKIESYARYGGANDKGAYRLKSGNFWLTARDNTVLYNHYIYAKEWNYGENPTGFQEGFNSMDFGLMGGGYNGGNPMTNTGYNGAFFMAKYPNYPWQNIWRADYSAETFYHWTNGDYYVPVRCILKSTSVD